MTLRLRCLGLVAAVLALAGCAAPAAAPPAGPATLKSNFTSFDLNGGGPAGAAIIR